MRMARYRTYKNGITGHRYKGLYIIRGDSKGQFSILDDSKTVLWDNLYDYEECEWAVDKNKASEEEIKMMKMLYDKEIYELSTLFVELMQKKQQQGLDKKSENLYKWVEKIRKRKAEDRLF